MSFLALVIFPFFKNAPKSIVFLSALELRSGSGAAISGVIMIMYVKVCLCKLWLCVKAGSV